MDVVSAIVGPVVESLMVPIKRHLGYLIYSTKYVRNMSTIMGQLDGTSTDVKNHMDRNNINDLVIPAHVPRWLKKVEKIKEDVESISSNDNGCFNMKTRYRVGRNAMKTTQEIERLIKEKLDISWTDTRKPLGKLPSKRASTSAPSSGDIQNDFKSRDRTFKDAMKFLKQDHKAQVIALCGMGGVGKSTMMERLKEAVVDQSMFDRFVKVVIGQQTNSFSIQQTVAENLKTSLTETMITTRADSLRRIFGELLKQGERILVILDDVWETVVLKDIGLSPLPNGVKLLLTSRYEDICTKIAVEVDQDIEVLRVNALEPSEAQSFLCRITGVSKEYDPDLYQIGGHIVKRCGCLPLAIKLIAPTLRPNDKSIWRDRLRCLKKNDLDKTLHEIIEISYNYLKKEEDKVIFLLCGLFPDDSNIPIEDLTRYAWGLKLLNEVPTLGEARDRTITCVHNLKNANLLIDSDYLGCVKMHDLVLAFVLDSVSKGDHAWIINHGDKSNSSRVEMSESCKIISLTCLGMLEFPIDFKYPNLSLLKLMHGDIKFPEDFYGNMEKLEVIAYENMRYPLLPRSLPCSTNLRTLCLDRCLLMFDCCLIGDLLNLEVLSFAYCEIRELPSTIGNLKKLRLLDLTGCVDLRIDDGVLKNLVKLEEIYMRGVAARNAVSFTDGSRNELAERSKNLSALEIEFFNNNAHPKSLSFNNLEWFKISMGRFLGIDRWQNKHSFENTLKLVTSKDELLDSRMNELFEKTEVLHLKVDGMKYLEDVEVKSLHPPPYSVFYNLKVFKVSHCAELRYLFTLRVASALSKLEHLKISSCPIMGELIHIENSGVEPIKFPKLKFLSLVGLPKLLSLCNTVNVIELPQLVELRLDDLPNFTSIYSKNKLATSSMSSNISAMQLFSNEEVLIPKLEKLQICRMEKLKEIWSCQITSNEDVNFSMLREIKVEECDSLVNLFPRNPLSLLRYLKELDVRDCGSIETLFNIDLGCAHEIEEGSCSLRRIEVWELWKLREVWRIKGVNNSNIPIHGFQDVESLKIGNCKSFRNLFTPTTANFDLGAVTNIKIDGNDWRNEKRKLLVQSSQEQEFNVISKEKISEVNDNIPNVAFPSYLIPNFHHLQKLELSNYKGIEVVFEIESASSRESATTWNLNNLELKDMERMTHVWKYNWNKFFILQQPPKSSFHNLTNIVLRRCKSIKYLFSPLMVKLLSNLKDVNIVSCDGIEEVVSNRDDEDEEMATSISTHTNTTFFPLLDTLELSNLRILWQIGGGGERSAITSNNNITPTSIHDQFQRPAQDAVALWSLCQYSRHIEIRDCSALSSVVPSHAVGHMQNLETLNVVNCKSMIDVFEIKRANSTSIYVGEGSGSGNGSSSAAMTTRKLTNMIFPVLRNLKWLFISRCDRLRDIFTFSTLESLKQLKELRIWNCNDIQVIVKEEDGEHATTSEVVVFPCLTSMDLFNLPNLNGFFMGKNDFEWPSLDKVKIMGCPKMTRFTHGRSTSPMLKYIRSDFGKYSLECGLNFHMTTASQETPFPSLDGSSSCLISERISWPFSDLIEIFLHTRYDSTNIIPSNELQQLQKLEKIYISFNWQLEEIFEAFEANNGLNRSQSIVEFPKLREVKLHKIPRLKYLWKSNQWTVLEFPSLTKLSIVHCRKLKHVFTCSMVSSLLQLQELDIRYCTNMEVIVKEEEDEAKTRVNEVEFRCLKSLTLYYLSSMKGFCLGKEAFQWPSLDTLEIKNCPEITVFTNGQLTTPKLKVIDTNIGLLDATEDPNSFIRTMKQEGFQFGTKFEIATTDDEEDED